MRTTIKHFATYAIGSLGALHIFFAIYGIFISDGKLFGLGITLGCFYTGIFLIMDANLRKEGRK